VKYFWSAFFIAWPVVAVAACLVAPGMGMWFPPQELGVAEPVYPSVNPLGRDIDDLFYLILVITGLVFLATQGALAWVLFRGASRPRNERAVFLHGNTKLEVLWTVIPGAILLFIAFDQLEVWANFRVVDAFPAAAREQPLAEIEAHQFGWQIRYAQPGKILSRDARPSDVYDNDRLYIPAGQPVLIWLRTRDVQHSFFIPQFRIKQDALPGQVIPVWFQADKPGEYQFLCAELCGWGHYKMGGMIVAQDPVKHDASMAALAKENYDDGVAE
jgi:cytochrome c oxidase subunit 2